MRHLVEKHVVTCFLEHGGQILILRRSEKVGTYQGRWAAVSGYVEGEPDRQALQEINEETGLGPEDVRLVRKGLPLSVEDETLGTTWIVHPYLFHAVDNDRVTIDWEHREMRWIDPGELTCYPTVPGLAEALARVRESAGVTTRTDSE